MKRCIAFLVILSLLPSLGCPRSKTAGVEHGNVCIDLSPDGKTVVFSSAGTCFGIANTFSGKLSEEQERMVPEALRGAFMIESLRKITASDLAKELESKTQVAEETHEGTRYVALKDFRCVIFSDEASGMMIVIERYLVIEEMMTNRRAPE